MLLACSKTARPDSSSARLAYILEDAGAAAVVTQRRVALPETALGGPVVGFNLYQPGEELIVAWTGTDPLHHLNLATLSV